MSDEDKGGTHGYVEYEGVTFVVDVQADSVFAPDDAVLMAAGLEWERRARSGCGETNGEPWREFRLDGSPGAFTVKITAPVYILPEDAAGAAAAFVEKVGGSSDTPVAPI